MSQELRVKVSYSPALGEQICDHLLNGKSLRQIEKMPGMPAARSVYRWLETNLEFRSQYQLARELWAHGFLDEILEIVDGKIIPFPERWSEGEVQQRMWLARIKLMVQTRMWIYHRLAPKKYVFLTQDTCFMPAARVEFIEDITYEVVEPLRISS